MASSDENEEFESADEEHDSDNELKNKGLQEKKYPEKIVAKSSTNKNNAEISKNDEIARVQDEKNVEKSVITGENDGWDDFGEDENWFENEASNTVKKSNIKEVTKTTNPNDGWDNFDNDLDEWIETKIEANPKQNINITSSYCAFPVLNSLETESPKKSSENCVRDKEILDSKTSPTNEATSSWAGWTPWGGVVSSVLSAATEGVTSLTSHVSQVIEHGIGAPEPEELVRINKKNESNDASDIDAIGKSNDSGITSFGNLMSGVTSIGNKVISGGLDTLEGIGKKTMTILQENDPLLLNKRRMMGFESERPVLSQVLREAKKKSEEVEKNLKQIQKQSYKKQLHFESLFDHYYGLVHLEALEMLSKQSSIKLQSLLDPLSGKALLDLNETLNEVTELCDLGDLESDDNEELLTYSILEEKLKIAIEDLGVQITFDEILKSWKKYEDQLENEKDAEPLLVYEFGLRCLAEICALQINKMHKIAELLIIKDHHSTANEADSLVQMTTIFCQHLHGIANKFGGKLNTFEQNEELSSLITNIFLEVYNSTSYVQSAFKLFIPILQIGAA